MLKRYGASSKHRKAADPLQPSAISVTRDHPETTHEEPLSIIDNNKVNAVPTVDSTSRSSPAGYP